MIENIKAILGISKEDNKFDDMILLYISKFSTIVVDYCNTEELNSSLESFIEDKVISIMKPKVDGGTENTGEIKAISRGDTKIEYNVASTVSSVSVGVNLSDSDRKFLNTYRKCRFL